MGSYDWYVAATLAGLENTAVFHLSREGITAFSPTATIERRAVRLFPGYLFVELARADEASVVNRTRGVHKMLPVHASSPLALRPGFVEGLRDRMARNDFDEAAAEEEVYRFAPKEEVLIKTGPFQDHRGRFLRYQKGAAVVMVMLFGREFPRSIPAKDIRSVRAYAKAA